MCNALDPCHCLLRLYACLFLGHYGPHSRHHGAGKYPIVLASRSHDAATPAGIGAPEGCGALRPAEALERSSLGRLRLRHGQPAVVGLVVSAAAAVVVVQRGGVAVGAAVVMLGVVVAMEADRGGQLGERARYLVPRPGRVCLLRRRRLKSMVGHGSAGAGSLILHAKAIKVGMQYACTFDFEDRSNDSWLRVVAGDHVGRP